MPRTPSTTPLAALALGAALVACSDPTGETCPGEAVASLVFAGARVLAGDPALAGLDPVPDVPDCPAAVGYPPPPADLPRFQGTLAADASTGAAALCRPRGFVLYGQRSGSRYAVEGGADGAVLDGCSATCSASLRLLVAGDVLAGPGGAPVFDGLLVEEVTRGDSDCGTCFPGDVRSCAARYTLEGRP